KTIVHHYGHGGAGVTLSWGTAAEAVAAAGALPARAAVIGAGAVGLATARLLQRKNITVTIYARELPPRTTSNVAGALWSPYLVADHDKRTQEWRDRFHAAARESFYAFEALLGSRF